MHGFLFECEHIYSLLEWKDMVCMALWWEGAWGLHNLVRAGELQQGVDSNHSSAITEALTCGQFPLNPLLYQTMICLYILFNPNCTKHS